MILLRKLRTPAAAHSVTLSIAFLIGIGAALVVLADARIIEYDHPLYFIGENLLIVSGFLGIGFAVLSLRRTAMFDNESSTPAEFLAIVAVATGGIALALLAQNRGGVTVYDAAISILIAVSMYLGLHPTSSTTQDVTGRWSAHGSRVAYALIAAILGLTGILRLIAAPLDVLTFILAPLAVFVVPGLALTLALQEDDTPMYVHLAMIPVLSLTSQMILIAWLLWLRIPITGFSLLAACVVISGIGVGGSVYRRRRTP